MCLEGGALCVWVCPYFRGWQLAHTPAPCELVSVCAVPMCWCCVLKERQAEDAQAVLRGKVTQPLNHWANICFVLLLLARPWPRCWGHEGPRGSSCP